MPFVCTCQAIAYGAAAVNYAEEKQLKQRDDQGKVIGLVPVAKDFEQHGLFGLNAKEWLTEMSRWQSRNGHGNIKNNFLWISFSPSPDVLAKLDTPEKWKEAHDHWLRFMGLDHSQRVTIMHHGADIDPERAHLHDIINRVDLNGNLISDKFIGNRAARAADQLSKLYGQKTAQEIGKERKKDIKERCYRALASLAKYSFQAFKEACLGQGVEVYETENKNGGIQGYTLVLSSANATEYKASDIDRNLTLKRIESLWQKLRRQALQEQEKEKEEKARKFNEKITNNNGTEQTPKPQSMGWAKQESEQQRGQQEQSNEQPHERPEDERISGWKQSFDNDEQSGWHWHR